MLVTGKIINEDRIQTAVKIPACPARSADRPGIKKPICERKSLVQVAVVTGHVSGCSGVSYQIALIVMVRRRRVIVMRECYQNAGQS
jgi:hypothetical protein